MPTRRGFWALGCLTISFAILLGGCGKRPLSTRELRAVTAEIVAAEQRVSARPSQISIRPELEPPWYGGEGRIVRDDIDISLENRDETIALAQALREIARRHGLSFSETSPPGMIRFDFRSHGSRTHTIRVTLRAGSDAHRPAEGTSASPELAIIIDDLGADRAAADAVLALGFPLTASVLPNQAFSTDVADRAYRRGDHVMLHLPMQAESESDPGGAKPETVELRVGMSDGRVRSILAGMLATVPHAGGVNNHEGSRATADRALMNALMAALHERGLYFIDSRTTAATVAYEAAESAGVAAASRKVFLDDTPTRAAVAQQLDLAASDARRDGSAIAIGHPHPETIRALADAVPRLEGEGVRLVFVSDLVH